MSIILEITKVKILKRLKYTKDFGFDFLVYYLQLSNCMFFSIDFLNLFLKIVFHDTIFIHSSVKEFELTLTVYVEF